MVRTIITIDEEQCNGCGLCVNACHEGAIGLVDGKAKLLRDDYCDGLGNCLPVCPTGAITFVEREADAYDHDAVMTNIAAKEQASAQPNNHQDKALSHDTVEPLACGCPGTQARSLNREAGAKAFKKMEENKAATPAVGTSALQQWPVQIKLVPIQAPYLHNADLLIAADCTAYAYADFHREYMQGKVTLIGCPKLDEGDYSEKLTAILSRNDIRSITVVRMEVPCCGGIVQAVKTALKNSGSIIPWQIVTISTEGDIL